MNITILAIGGRGDVEPLLILGEELCRRGSDISVVTHPDFGDLVHSYGLTSVLIRASIKELFEGEYGSGTYSTETNYFRSWFNFYKMFGSVLYSTARDSWEACRGADLIIYSPPCLFFAPQIAEKLNIRSIPVFFQPFHPTGEFPSYISPIQSSYSSLFNLLTHKISDYIMWMPYLSTINRFRKECLNLTAISVFSDYISKWRMEHELFIYAFSRFVVPGPRDWQENAKITGYFVRNKTGYIPDDNMLEFIEAGDKPVFIGFSSTVIHEPGRFSEILVEAFRRLGKRVVLVTGWGGLGNMDFPDNFFKVRSVPHDWLFPQMSLLIHHGGAGSTGAALRSGVPSVVIPFAADQYFWGRRVYKTGCGPEPLPARNLTAEKLYRTVNHVLDGRSYYLKAEDMAGKINSENGVENAVNLIADFMKRSNGAEL